MNRPGMRKGLALMVIFVLVITVCPAWATERPMNELPMYGGKHDPVVPTNKNFSRSAAELGWKYYYAGDFDTAIKRFNQAWMFDRQSTDAFWGFGLVMGQRAEKEDQEHNLRESIKYLAMANSSSPRNGKIMVDLAFSYTLLGAFLIEKKESAKGEFAEAKSLYEQAAKLEPQYPLVYANWGLLEFFSGHYPAAQHLLRKAKDLGFKPDPAYEKELEGKIRRSN